MAAEVSKSLALLFAMEAEAKPLIDALGLKPTPLPDPVLPFRYYTGVWKGLKITLGCNGTSRRHGVDQIGTEAAALNAFLAWQTFHPSLVISAGTAGSAKHLHAQPGEVFLSNGTFTYLDHRIPLPGFKEFGLGSYLSADTAVLAKELGLRQAKVASRSSLDFNVADWKCFQESGAGVEDMEAASIAWVCEMTRTPFFAIKAITNEVSNSDTAADDFEKNLAPTVLALRDTVVRVLETLATGPWPGLPN